MEDTANCEECPLKKLKDKGKCPNYIENWWTSDEEEKPRLVKDCAPIRTLLMLQDLYNKIFGMQRQQAELCGQFHNLSQGLRIIAKEYLETKDVIELKKSGLLKDDIPTLPDSSS